MRTKSRVYRLPTEDKENSAFVYDKTDDGFEVQYPEDTEGMFEHEDYVGQHLYLTTRDAVKTGEWCFEMHEEYESDLIRFPSNIDGQSWFLRQMNMNCSENDPECLKIVSSTDPALGLPMPPIEFVEKYCIEKGIKEVYIEYETLITGQCNCRCHHDNMTMHIMACCNPTTTQVPKTVDNKIFIQPVLKNLSIDEVRRLLWKTLDFTSSGLRNMWENDMDEWIDNNKNK